MGEQRRPDVSNMTDIASWTVRDKVGQLFVCGFHGHTASEGLCELIEQYGLGGTIYFSRNIMNAEQVHTLSSSIQKVAEDAGRPPLFTAIDQEGGMVARLVEGVTLMPGNMALGATGSDEGARETARVCGEELRLLGVNMNYAPCLDVNNNPNNPVINVRSYSDRPDLVSRLGTAAVLGYQSAGIAATVKHFPGHGDTDVDSHRDLPVVAHSRERLDAVELVPFRAAISAGADVIMTAHVCLPVLDPSGVPSTLSEPVITGLLREELGYDGVVVTDCLEMNAIDTFYGPEQGAVMALKAGADMVLVSHTLEKQRAAIEAVIAAVESGELPLSRVEEAAGRVLRLKERRTLTYELQPWEEVAGQLAAPEHRAVAQRWSEASVTLVKDEMGLLPLSKDAKTLVLWPDIVPVSEADEMLAGDGTLGASLVKQGFTRLTERIMSSTEPLASLEAFDQIIVATYDAVKHPLERRIAEEVIRLAGERCVMVSVRNPLDLTVYPNAAVYLAVYECRSLALASAAKALAGELQPLGRLPLELSPAYPYGWSWAIASE
ncbi:glycoside hydrolase family 3 protein [Paenibacillus sp. GCM10023252]|uniref:glycoside hydrolase family 3 protein n=1 Tax=Paenibacillus sp. GCM10023252 TaxID=3252649 RepID=UPI003612C578